MRRIPGGNQNGKYEKEPILKGASKRKVPWLCAPSSGLVMTTMSSIARRMWEVTGLGPPGTPFGFLLLLIGGDTETNEIDNIAKLSTLYLGFTSHL